MLNIHVTGCNVCPFAVYEYFGGGSEWVCKLIYYINPKLNECLSDDSDVPTTIPDNCPLDVSITK